jgi:prepilin-type N-terminal cleavage/methylation domain-containing protein
MARRGMTLVELLVVIAIIGLLAAFLTPALVAARARARQIQCINNQGEIGKAILHYEMIKRRFPGYANRTPAFGSLSSTGNLPKGIYASWPVTIMKQIGRDDLWYKWREGNADFTQATIELFVCPSDNAPEPGALSYVVNCGQRDYPKAAPPIPPDWPANGIFHNRVPGNGKGGRLTRFVKVSVSITDIKDGTSSTLLLSENVQAHQWCDADETWAGMIWRPGNNQDDYSDYEINADVDIGSFCLETEEELRYQYARPSSFHPGGAVATFCDGSARLLSDRISYLTYQLIMTPDGKNAKYAGDSSTPPADLYWRTATLDENDLDF